MGTPSLHQLKHYIKFLLRAKGAHAIHSPFVYQLYVEVIRNTRRVRIRDIEKFRKELLKNHKLIDVMDFKTNGSQRKTISSVARTSLSSPKFTSFLYLLANHLQAKTILETGTSLGISAAYLGKSKAHRVVSMEGSSIMHELAKRNLEALDVTVDLLLGDIHKLFQQTIAKYRPDFIFLDADHRGSATLSFIDEIMQEATGVKCIIIHDIYWSEDMTDAWLQVVNDSRFNLTIDIFQAGLIFPALETPKQHFTLRF